MKLLERIVLGNILPKEGNFTDLIVIEDVRKKIEITQKEITDYEIRQNESGLSWNDKGVKSDKKIEFSELEKEVIKKALEKLNEEEKLDANTITLYKQFCK